MFLVAGVITLGNRVSGEPTTIGFAGFATSTVDNPNTAEAKYEYPPTTATSLAPPTPGIKPMSSGTAEIGHDGVLIVAALLCALWLPVLSTADTVYE